LRKKLLTFASICTFMLAGCGANETSTVNTNTELAGSPSPVEESSVTTSEENGVRTETRTFTTGRVERVVVTTRDGKRSARVYMRTGEVRDLPENRVDTALEATGDAIAEAATEVADKTEDAAKETADKAKDIGSEVGDKAEDVGDATKKGVKKTGSKIKDALD
jgi:Mg2+ and Co2+ transporter CorA